MRRYLDMQKSMQNKNLVIYLRKPLGFPVFKFLSSSTVETNAEFSVSKTEFGCKCREDEIKYFLLCLA